MAATASRMRFARCGVWAAGALLAGCASAPPAVIRPAGPPAVVAATPLSPTPATDGPPADPPPDLAEQPDPEPRVEPLRSGGPNKPYEIMGERYIPLRADEPFEQYGLASWYGRKFHGRRTASGEVFDMYALTAAHPTLPIPSYAVVRNPRNGREVVVRINDRGPFDSQRIIDLSYAAAVKLGVERGVAPVAMRRLTHDDIRSGRWRREPPAVATLAGAPPATTPSAAPSADRPTVPEPAAAPAPATAAPATVAPTTAGRGFWVQFGAFGQRDGAFDLRQQLMNQFAWLEHWLTVFDERNLYRVQAGPFATRTDAQGAADRVRAAVATPPLVLQRR